MKIHGAYAVAFLFTVTAISACGDGDEDISPPNQDGSAASDGANLGDGGAGDAAPKVNLDPAPGLNTPGNFTVPTDCPGCPSSDVATFDLNAGAVTTRAFSGTVTGAQGNGTFYVRAPTGSGQIAAAATAPNAYVPATTGTNGFQELSGPIPTSSSGAFNFTAPLFCGEQIVKAVWTNDAGLYVLIMRVVTEDCTDADIRVTISWDALGRDWELHLVKPGGRINDTVGKTDCTWTTCISAQPDWGVVGDPTDNPKKDVDNTSTYGPENIFYSKPEVGRYHVMVEHWGGGDPMSSGQAIINVRGTVSVFNIMNLAPQWVWTVATIDWPSGTVTPVNTLYNCTGSWASGCTAEIP